jgi:ATP-dependent Lon protease
LHAYVPGWDFPKLNPTEHVTNHFGLVSDFLSECWDRLRLSNRVSVLQSRVHLGGALSGRDIEAVNKTVSGLAKLLFPDPAMPVSDEDLEAMVRLALESRRRVKEQQRRVFKSEFRNTHFSYILGPEGVEQFVSTPEQHSDEAIESDPLPPGQVWGASPGSGETGAGPVSDRSDVWSWQWREDPQPADSSLIQGKREGRRAESSIRELRSWSATATHVRRSFPFKCGRWMPTRAAPALGLPVLVALCGALLNRNTRGGTVVVGALNLGGSVELIPNAIRIVELAIDKQAQTILMPVAVRRQLNDLPDELWTKINIEFYKDSADAVFKALVE